MLADAICDRLLHNSHRLVLKGPTRRIADQPGLTKGASLRSASLRIEKPTKRNSTPDQTTKNRLPRCQPPQSRASNRQDELSE